MASKELESGLAKLTMQSTQLLNSWKFDVKFWCDSEHIENACEKRGCISGYLNALVHMGTIELNEAIELYQYFTH